MLIEVVYMRKNFFELIVPLHHPFLSETLSFSSILLSILFIIIKTFETMKEKEKISIL